MAARRKAPLPVPVQTTMGKRWRWDRFANRGEAVDWYEARKAQGHRVHLQIKGAWVAWDQTVKPGLPPPASRYPKQRIDHCRHCGERRTYDRQGTGKRVPRSTWRREYTYTEVPPHDCAGLRAERVEMAKTTARLSRLIARALSDR